jgi:hypothetical protein
VPVPPLHRRPNRRECRASSARSGNVIEDGESPVGTTRRWPGPHSDHLGRRRGGSTGSCRSTDRQARRRSPLNACGSTARHGPAAQQGTLLTAALVILTIVEAVLPPALSAVLWTAAAAVHSLFTATDPHEGGADTVDASLITLQDHEPDRHRRVATTCGLSSEDAGTAPPGSPFPGRHRSIRRAGYPWQRTPNDSSGLLLSIRLRREVWGQRRAVPRWGQRWWRDERRR